MSLPRRGGARNTAAASINLVSLLCFYSAWAVDDFILDMSDIQLGKNKCLKNTGCL